MNELSFKSFYLIISSTIRPCGEDQKLPQLQQIHLLSALKMHANVFRVIVRGIIH